MTETEDILNDMQKKTYNDELERLGYFCQVCGREVRNEHGLVHFTSTETVQSLNVCQHCLPEWFE